MTPAPSKMCVTADTVAFRCAPAGGLQVLLVRRGNPPFEGQWALPGGFVELEEDLPDAALRELLEETGAEPRFIHQSSAWGKPGRDPRGHTVTVAYLAIADARCEVRGADDAAQAGWHPVDALPPLAFDHADIIAHTLEHLRDLCRRTYLPFAFLDGEFTISELRRVVEALAAGSVVQTDAEDLLERARNIEKVADDGPGGEAKYRCAAGDFLAPLADR